MSKYTIELRYIYEDKNYKLFDFAYNLYDNDLKPYFEQKFFNHFMFHEIGFETIGKFKHYLKTTLNEIYPYYKQLYETQIRSQSIDFMLNKDLKETYIRELNSESNGTNNSTNNSISNNTAEGISTSHQPPQQRIDNLDNFVDGAEKTKANDTSNVNSTSNNESNIKSNNTEKYEMISQGNIGITSSAELLTKWRETIIDIDRMIFNELESLFMQVF